MENIGLDLKLSPKQWAALTTEGTEVLYGGAAGSESFAS